MHRRRGTASALLLGLWVLVGAASFLAPQAAVAQGASQADPIKVLVAVLPFRIHSAKPLGYLEESLADLLSSRLEASGRIQVVDAVIVREALVDYAAGELSETAVRKLARELGAEFVVAGSLTELAGTFSLDVRVTPVQSDAASETMVYTAASEEALLDRVNELADAVLASVTRSARTLVSEVRLVGAEQLPPDTQDKLITQAGAPYDSRQARLDLETLRDLPGVATATLETERAPDGVVVIYRVVPSVFLFGVEGADEPGEGEPVAEVRVQGNRRIEADAIRARIATQPGDAFIPAQLSADVREVYGLGFFRNVKVLSEESPDGRIIIFEVEENPVVRRVSITGNENVDGDKIRDALTLTTGSTLDYPLLFENRVRIEALYRAEGYYLASVGYEIEEISPEAVAINFDVSEGGKLRLTEIVFDGNEAFEEKELRQGLKTKPWRWWSYATKYLDNSGTYSEPIFLQDLRTIEDKYANEGYIQVEVGEPEVDTSEGGLRVTVPITEGDQFSVGLIDVTGDETVDIDALRQKLLLEEGETFNRAALATDVEILNGHYANRGFYFVNVNPRTEIDADTKAIDIEFQVEKGPLHFIREIEFAGNTTTIDPVLRREVQLVEGQLYSARAIDISRARLQGLGFFEEVNFELQPTDQPDQLDLDVRVVERPTGSLSFGAGFSSQDAFVLSGSLSQSNLFGRGYAVRASVDWGGRSNRFFLSFSDPYVFGTQFGFSGTAFQTEVEFEDFEQEQSGIDLNLSHVLDQEGRSRGFLRYNFSNRDLTEDSFVNASSPIFRQILSGEQSTSLLGLSFRTDKTNDRVVPTAGYQLAASAEFAGLGGFSKFIRVEGRGAWYKLAPDWFPIFPERSTFSIAARGGWAVTFNDIDDYDNPEPTGVRVGEVTDDDDNVVRSAQVRSLDQIDDDLTLPLTERYFLGGLGTFQLRGYRARSVGPRRAILRRGGALGTSNLFAPVGFDPFTNACQDFDFVSPNLQGDKDGECNDIDDRDDDDFDDLDETDVIGGNKFFSASFDYRFPISEQLGLMGIVFFDMGNAFAEDQSIFDVTNWRYGTGVGALWFSPFGPLQAFWGIPLNKLEVEDSNVFEFSVGGANF